MSRRGWFTMLASAALIGALLVACGGGKGDGSGGQSQRVTDPARVPTSTPVAQGNPIKFEIHQDGSLSVSGGPTVEASPVASPSVENGGGRANEYTVQSGDTCGAIASQFGLTADQLIAANRSTINESCTNLQPGDKVKIPAATTTTTAATQRPNTGGASTPTARAGSKTYVVQSGDTCSAIAASYGVPVDALISLNGLDAGCRNLQPGQTLKIPG